MNPPVLPINGWLGAGGASTRSSIPAKSFSAILARTCGILSINIHEFRINSRKLLPLLFDSAKELVHSAFSCLLCVWDPLHTKEITFSATSGGNLKIKALSAAWGASL